MSNSVEDLANAWHAPFCAVDAGGGCILDSDLKEAWIAGYSAALERAQQEMAELRAENERMRERATRALSRYGQHAATCGRFTTISGECSCGYQDSYRLLWESGQAQGERRR